MLRIVTLIITAVFALALQAQENSVVKDKNTIPQRVRNNFV